jgi:hypothetical protein
VSGKGQCHFAHPFEFQLELQPETPSKSPEPIDSIIDIMSDLKVTSESTTSKSSIPLAGKLPEIEVRVGSLDRWKCQSSVGIGRLSLCTSVGLYRHEVSIRAPTLRSMHHKLKQKFLKYSFDFDHISSALQVRLSRLFFADSEARHHSNPLFCADSESTSNRKCRPSECQLEHGLL